MKPEIQEKYKLYLEKKGYDVSQLPWGISYVWSNFKLNKFNRLANDI
jgi:hypothetical protein